MKTGSLLRALGFFLSVPLLIPPPLHAENEVGFIERFALAPDREKALGELIPGTEESYYFQALHYENSGQKEKLAAVLDQWEKRFPHSRQRVIIQNRQALLSYGTEPQKTLAYLKAHLNLSFNDQQEARDKKPNLPTSLDQRRIAREVFLKAALRQDDDLSTFSEAALERLVLEKTPLGDRQRRALLARINWPEVPGLVDLVAADLQTKESRGFGEFPIHKMLLAAQLDELGAKIPSLLDSRPFVIARLHKLAPGADADAEFNPAEREALLERLWNAVKTLPPVFNTLKAGILYHRLEADRRKGVYDKARFGEYLKLPRQLPYVNPEWLRQNADGRTHVNLNGGEGWDLGIPGLPPIGNDEPLVRDYFLHLFAGENPAETWEAYKQWVRESWLKPVYAEAKIVSGAGNPEQWASLLTPAQFQKLKERVDIDFAPDNAAFLPAEAEVALRLFVKNTPKLIVKVYEINTLGFYLQQKRQLNTDLDLDGLIANAETTREFAETPFRRVAATLTFPELKGRRGAWIIELIGGGKSSRALIRKGQWTLLQKTSPAGDLLTVLDETNTPVPNAVVWLDGRKWASDEKAGGILVPFTGEPGRKPVVVSDAKGSFATLAEFEHHGESYRLDAQFHIAREQLFARREATLAIRPALLLGGTRIALGLLKEAKLTLTSTTLDGVETVTEIKSPKLESTKVFTHRFAVPERLARLSATLSGKVEILSKGGEKQVLSASDTWEVNGMDRTRETSDGHLSRFGEDYVFELLGKDGEPLADQQVVFTFVHRDFTEPQEVALRTDEKGRVALGKLSGIARVKARVPNGREGAWTLRDSVRTLPESISALEGETIRVPWMGTDEGPGSLSLLEMRLGEFAGDQTRAVKKAGDFLEIAGLKAGDYVLRFPQDGGGERRILLRITQGKPVDGWLIGANRRLEASNPAPLQIRSAQASEEGVRVQLQNWNKTTRVHVAATRFLPGIGLMALGDFTRFEPGRVTPGKFPNLFAAGREIGDEYRYILERRYAAHFPGNMLTRPGLILNPWEKRSTDALALGQAKAQLAQATAGSRSADQVESSPNRGAGGKAGNGAGRSNAVETTSLDFLAESAPVLYNLLPDDKGVVLIPRKAFGDRQFIQVYAEDVENAVWKTLAVGEQGTKFHDLRLAQSLDPAKSFAGKKEVSLLLPGQSLTLPDLLTGDLEVYDSLAGVYSLFTALNGPNGLNGADTHAVSAANLAKFAWVLQWPTLGDEEKRAKYSEFACHELNFFLSRKDPKFFAAVVQPYLNAKKEKTFMDDYLVENGPESRGKEAAERRLKPYLEPWAFARLNAAEKALLAQALPAEAANIARHLRELWELLPPDPEREDYLFETALRGRALQALKDKEDGRPEEEKGTNFRDEKARRERAAEPALKVRSGNESQDIGSFTGGWAKKGGGVMGGEPAGAATNMAMPMAMPTLAVPAAAEAPLLKQSEALLDLDTSKSLREVAAARAYYRELGPTKEWAENNYYQLPIERQTAGLVPVNAFWNDYAKWVADEGGKAKGEKKPFLSSHVAEASRNFTEMMLALAVLDLPFDSPRHETRTEGNAYTLTAGGPLIAFHKEIKPVDSKEGGADGEAELLVSENFYREGDRYREERGERFDKYVTGEFLTGVVYGGAVVLTNPGASVQKVELLLQIPQGALPVLGSKTTDSRRVRLEPYTTQTFDYFFYFPEPPKTPETPKAGEAGVFGHYPAHVAKNERAAGAAKPFSFKVVDRLSRIDETSWDYVSQYGSESDVFAFLDKHNLNRLALRRVAWRCRESAPFFHKLVALLSQRHRYDDAIYRYGVYHNDTPALREWLRHRDDFIAQCGPWLSSPLLTIDPVERRTYEHLEYFPLVNQRAHRLGAEVRIANPVLRGQYRHLLEILAHKPSLDADDNLAVVYYLFLQDRVEEALARFQTINLDEVATRLQADYFRCYAAFYEQKLGEARKLAQTYADYPVDRWRKLFAAVADQLDEIEGKAGGGSQPGQGKAAHANHPDRPDRPDREEAQSGLAAAEPSFDFKVESRTLAIDWQNLAEVTVNYYRIDPEFSFSGNPFVSGDASRFGIIKPSKSVRQPLPEGKNRLEIPLPEEFAKSNVLVEILGAGQRKTQAYHANTLKLTLAENYGRLEVRELKQAGEGKPIAAAYVKVYARLRNGTVRFFKDGYTDLRGRFDYASLNSSSGPRPLSGGSANRTSSENGEGLNSQMLAPGELGEVERLAILVMSDDNGDLVREVSPPSQ